MIRQSITRKQVTLGTGTLFLEWKTVEGMLRIGGELCQFGCARECRVSGRISHNGLNRNGLETWRDFLQLC